MTELTTPGLPGRTISVRLDPAAGKQIDKASELMRQSRAAFLEKAGAEAARRVLLEWAARRRRQGDTLSELAEQTGLALEDIAEHVGREDRADALDMFLASCRTVAQTQNNARFLRLAEQAVAAVAGADVRPEVMAGRTAGTARTVREARSPYRVSGAGQTAEWRRDGDRLLLLRVSDAQRDRIDQLVADFGAARPGGRGGSAALASELAGELDAGFLSRATATRLARWCHSNGPSYRGVPQQAARALSEALLGGEVPDLSDPATSDVAWRELVG